MNTTHMHTTHQVCRVVLTLLSDDDIGDQLYASGLLCVAELMRALGPHLIPSLPQLMACVLKYIGNIQEGWVWPQGEGWGWCTGSGAGPRKNSCGHV